MPEYFASPPGSLRRYQADRSWRFWLPLHAVTLPALVLPLVGNWSTDRRVLVLAATICYAASWIATLIWFIPGVIEFNKVDPSGVSAARQATPVSAAASGNPSSVHEQA